MYRYVESYEVLLCGQKVPLGKGIELFVVEYITSIGKLKIDYRRKL